MFCKNCGIEIPEDSKFCFKCGTKTDLTIVEQNNNVFGPIKAEEIKQIEIRFKEELEELRILIAEKDSEKIHTLLNTVIDSKESGTIFIENYKVLFSSDLIQDINNLSSSYDKIKSYLQKFIDFEIVEKLYPHNRIGIITKDVADNVLLNRRPKKGQFNLILKGALLVIGCVIIFKGCSYFMNDANTPTYNKFTAYTQGTKIVKRNLIAPGTAKFPGTFEQEQHVRDLGNGVFLINSWVDSENRFGALIRLQWTCTIMFEGDKASYKNFEMHE